jgi:carbon monoxide dehydrogenase subunit G
VAHTGAATRTSTFTFTFEPVDGGTRFTRKGDIRINAKLKQLLES